MLERKMIMSRFDNVTVVKKANIYSNGAVTSRTVLFSDGSKKTLGIMIPGEYTFNTDLKEIMEILEGELDALLPGSSTWVRIKAGESFEVPAASTFSMKVLSITDYCCSYIA